MSPGCEHCYAEVVAARFSGAGQPYEGLAKRVNGHARWTNTVRFVPEHLEDPLHWRTPRRIFVNSMSDLFHEQVTDAVLDQIFAVMAACPQHTFQILTKRPARMRDYCRTYRSGRDMLPNVWLGTSVEDQQRADERIPQLLETPAAVRFVSCEPLLAPLNINWYLFRVIAETPTRPVAVPRGDLHWVIVGGESGPGHREMRLEWARELQRCCAEAGVAFWFKQDSGPRSGMGEGALGAVYQEFPA